jgi:tetratricopeptide (TPR) repeat protein
VAQYYRTAGYAPSDINDLKKAIDLDPSDSWSYAYVAWAQIDVGQPADAFVFIKTAMRLDPHYPPIFLHILGLAQFGQAQFADAAASLDRAARLNPEDEYPLLALAAAYGHLGRKPDALAAADRYSEIRVRHGGIPLTLANAPSATFAKYAQNALLIKGLRLAGIPETFRGSEFAAKNRLGTGDIRALFLGHRLRGRTFESDEEHEAIITATGVATLSGDWGTMSEATTEFTGDELCFAEVGGGHFCASILRNPGGSNLKQNELIWLDRTGAYPFSQVE